MSKRQENIAKRKAAIVAATQDLFSEQSGELVSADRIAERAGVSTATVYNLVGKREQLLGAVLGGVFAKVGDEIEKLEQSDAILRGEALIAISTKHFVAKPRVYKAVIHEMSGGAVNHIVDSVSPSPIDLQIDTLQMAARHGCLIRQADPERAAWQVFLSYNGALFLWAGGHTTNKTFLNQALHGYWTVIAAFGAEKEKKRAFLRLSRLGSPAGRLARK